MSTSDLYFSIAETIDNYMDRINNMDDNIWGDALTPLYDHLFTLYNRALDLAFTK